MGTYQARLDRPGRAKAIGGVIAVHALLAAVILSGLNVHTIRRAVEHWTTIDVREPPPPPPPQPPPPAKQPNRVRLEEGAAGKKAEPTPVVAPKPRLEQPSPVVAAPVAGTGVAPSAGASNAGAGPGAGGTGAGRGGGGTGDFARFTPARLVRNLSRGDYAALATGRLPVGSADAAIAIGPDGAVRECRLLRSSGDATIDHGLCPLLKQRLRFRPALDDTGRPIAYRTNYRATWRLGF